MQRWRRLCGRVAGWRAVFALLLLAASPAPGDEVAYDQAPVLWVEPLTETVTRAVSERVCPPPAAGTLGDLRAAAPGLDLAAAIRAEAQRPPARPACFDRPGTDTGERIVGYRVGYRYGGDSYVRTMREHPGEAVRVRVSVRPAVGRAPDD